ncbi:chloride channel [Paecilomyces variotii]|uniref:Chloride channel n=1 Tax=Byssochlamys spectabilis TaxID=264951 RepID=A0A443HXR3_BYSSP|nr:chloride channel [Paecilomyces variotii]KAJ9243460.1 hypothetical protein DTO169E5_2703 [Paecilomyces variotii]KAJ9357512.1 hypothetical protein DTO280E4_5627 [Paecilomyces variotii]RWQ96613.1 chloride channel [Paecilomyces variotii]
MPRSTTSVPQTDDEENDYNGEPTRGPMTAPPSPSLERRLYSRFADFDDAGSRSTAIREDVDETTSLLGSGRLNPRGHTQRSYTGLPQAPRPGSFFRHNSAVGSVRRSRNHSRTNSQAIRFSRSGSPVMTRRQSTADNSKDPMMSSSFLDERAWYDQFTSTDWVHDSISDGIRLRELRSRRDVRGRLLALFDSAQGWILVAVTGCITAAIAYFVDVNENSIHSLKEGFCTSTWFLSKANCCKGEEQCHAWRSWSQILTPSGVEDQRVDFVMFVFWATVLATASCCLTLLTKTVVPSSVALTTLDENLGADSRRAKNGETIDDPKSNNSPTRALTAIQGRPDMVYYSAAGSGVAEVKVILSGFVLHGYLGLKTLILKTLALILSVSSGLSLGKEGPYVHIATCVGNICCRMFSKYHQNDGKRREVLSASAASGVAVAFGAPIGGVLFSLEEVSYYFPPKTLFRTFFCCIAAALSLKFLNPYGTGKIVLFQVRYVSDWEMFEMILFIVLGILGGALGALFIKASSLWARSFRRIPIIKKWPVLEVALVALITGITSFWNRYTKLAVAELLLELASPCGKNEEARTGLCPDEDGIMEVVRYLLVAFVIKSLLTTVTFGIKVPAGIYVPSMVVGGLMGRIVGHIAQYFVVKYPTFFLFGDCPNGPGMESCVTPGVYALIAAGATMCGVTRLSVTLAVILFELTGSLDHVLPFSIAVLCAKWTADAIEPMSIYDLLTDMNDYPFLDNKMHPLCDAELGDIVPPVRQSRIIDISKSPLVPARELREKLDHLLVVGELDSGLPIVRNDVLVGLIPVPDLEFALDKLKDEESAMCIMSADTSWAAFDSDDDNRPGPADFTPYIDPAPIALDIHSPVDLVYQCFVKLGLRYLCVLQDGQYAGLVHKKTFVKFMKEHEES